MQAPLAPRLLSTVRRDGVWGVFRRLGGRARTLVHLRETHVWYVLELGRHPRIRLPVGLELVRGGPSDVELLERLPSGSAHQAEARLAEGGELWLMVDEEEEPAFACWVFRGRTPVVAARGGWLALPEGTICLEDSVTSPDYRGRGAAPSAWSQVAEAALAEGHATMITKVAEVNAASRRAVEKAGFREVATMRLTRFGSHARVEVEAREGEPVGRSLAQRLERDRRGPWEATVGSTARRAVRGAKAGAIRLAFEHGDMADTSSEVRLEEVGLGHPERILYSPSSWLFLPRVMRSLDVGPSDVFVDFGSGKGRVVYQAARYPFRRVVGVEISEELNRVARANVERARHRLRCQNVELVTADVLDYEIPDDMTYAYFYYPFFGEIFRNVVDRIAASVDRNPRKVTIIFTDPEEVGGVRSTASEIVAIIEATGRFELRRRHRLGLGRRNHSIAVYESRATPLASQRRG